MESVRIPGTVRTIAACAFLRCGSLRAIDLPDSLEVIERGAFAQCGLERVEIPRGVTEIGARAFEGCAGLAEVRFAGGSALRRLGKDVFAGVPCGEVPLPAGVEAFSDGEYRE